MRLTQIRCKNFKCQHQNEKGECTTEEYPEPCFMDCGRHSYCRFCATDCKEPDEYGFILK